MAEEHRDALRGGCEIEGYRIERVLGSGGFGITYLASDMANGDDVVLKEYIPSGLAFRERDSYVSPLCEEDREDFAWGMQRFTDEAYVLVSVQHPNIVPIRRFFHRNGTAYMVMDYRAGEDLAKILHVERTLCEADLRAVVLPLLDGLGEVHRSGYMHRDIKPGNIFICDDGRPILLDFGAARQALGRRSRKLTAVISPGYAPFEQYGESGRQGAWSDIYALGGVMYRAIAGKAPPSAPDRKREDPMVPAAELGAGRYEPRLLHAVDQALSVENRARPQSVEAFRALLGRGTPSRPAAGDAPTQRLAQGGARR